MFFAECQSEDTNCTNAALLAHAFNVLPKVVAALEKVLDYEQRLVPCPDDGGRNLVKQIRAALAEADNVNV